MSDSNNMMTLFIGFNMDILELDDKDKLKEMFFSEIMIFFGLSPTQSYAGRQKE